MASKVWACMNLGFEGTPIQVECHLANSLPAIVIVGLAAKAVDEAKERLRAAITSSGLKIPRKRIIINLAPADIPKSSSELDFSMAASILSTAGIIPEFKNKTMLIGELGLDGSLRPVRGLIGALLTAKRAGFKDIYLPEENLQQANLIAGLNIYAISNLAAFYKHLCGTSPIGGVTTSGLTSVNSSYPGHELDISDIVGQNLAKRALAIAAAGHHNILFSGSPGVGKSMLAKALPSILPPLTSQEIVEVTYLHSLVGGDCSSIKVLPPFRAPHHSTSTVALLGGGQNPRPGEVSLAHKGALFLDELPEFTRSALEGLRQPLEDRKITIARAKDSITYPADIMIIATRNPCPCGYYNSAKHECTCSPLQIIHYEQKLSGPLMDRIDIHSNTEEIDHSLLLSDAPANHETSAGLSKKIGRARARQKERYGQTGFYNSQLSTREVKKYIRLDQKSRRLLDSAASSLALSARSYIKTVKVARSIADFEDSDEIQESHIAEALQYRARTT